MRDLESIANPDLLRKWYQKTPTKSLAAEVVRATAGPKLQKFADGGDLEFCAFQQVVKPSRNVTGKRGHATLAHAHDPSQVFLIGKVGGIVVDLHAVNSTFTEIERGHKIVRTLLIDVANDGLGR